MHEKALEPAINDFSCSLACLVSLCRELGLSHTQQSIIDGLKDHFPDWKERPGSLPLERLINLAATLLGTSGTLITPSKSKLLEYWRRPERVGALVITGLQPNAAGAMVRGNHAWRMLECDEEKVVLMNPKPGGADIRAYNWTFFPTMKGYGLVVEKSKSATAGDDPYI